MLGPKVCASTRHAVSYAKCKILIDVRQVLFNLSRFGAEFDDSNPLWLHQ